MTVWKGENHMANTLDYLDWRGDLSLETAPFCEVDSLLLSQLAYLPMDGLVPGRQAQGSAPLPEVMAALTQSKAEKAVLEHYRALGQNYRLLAEKLKNCPRFRDVRLCRFANDFDEAQQKQFSAVSVLLPDGCVSIAYRGTDNTLVGWKEDFNMSFITPVPAQREAVQYLAETAHAFPKAALRLGGHSKGGNLAVYAAAFCGAGIQSRILSVHSHDGPGFQQGVMDNDGYRAVNGRITTFVPQSSVVGMLLEHEEEYVVVHSTGSGPFQHDSFSWEVLGPAFVKEEGTSAGSRMFDETLKDWLSRMDATQREQFSDALFELFGAAGATTLKELTASPGKTAGAVLGKLAGLDADTRGVLLETLGELMSATGKTLQHTALERPGKGRIGGKPPRLKGGSRNAR